jgi:PAS domain S-box-containing protein
MERSTKILLQVSQMLLKSGPMDLDMSLVLSQLRELSGAKFGIYNAYSDDGMTFQNKAISGFPQLVQKAYAILGFSLDGRNWEISPERVKEISVGMPVRFKDLYALAQSALSRNTCKLIEGAIGTKSIYVIEINAHGKTIGDFILFFNRDSELQNPAEATTIANMTGVALHRQKSEEQILQKEKNFRAFFDTIDNYLFILDMNGNVLEYNKTARDKLLYEPSEVIGKSVLNLHPASRRDEAATIVKEMLEGKAEFCPVPLITSTNKLIPVETYVKHGVWNGKPAIFGVSKDISALKESEEKFAAAFNLNPAIAGLSLLETGEFVEVNRAFTEKLGYSKEEVIGQKSTDVLKLDPKFRNRNVTKLSSEGRIFNEEGIIFSRNGDPIDVLFSAEVLELNNRYFNYTTGIDITHRKRLEESLRENQLSLQSQTNRLMALIAHLPGGILLETHNRKVRVVNQRFCEMFGIPAPPETLLGADCRQCAQAAGRLFTAGEDFTSRIEEILSEGKPVLNEELPLNDGRVFERDFLPVKLDEGINEILWYYRDISPRKKFEQELEKARLRAEESDRLKSAFLANMSHEIRSPLNGILGFSDLLRGTILSKEKTQEFAEIIFNRGNHLMRLINDIIDVSKLDSGQMKINPVALDLDALLREISHSFSQEMKLEGKGNIRLELVSPFQPFWIETDEMRLRQVLENLLSNAVKFTETGTIEFGYHIRDSYLQFYVKDTGAGIPEDMQESIFDRFIQAAAHNEKQYGGTGLGLAIARACTRLLGGDIKVESTPGEGSVFYFTIEYHKAGMNKPGISEELPDTSLLNHDTILIAEDDDVSYRYFKEVLGEYDLTLLRSTSVKDTVNIALGTEPVKLVLLDIQLTDGEGWEAVRIINKHKPNLPIIAQTAYAFENDRQKSLKAGCNDYIAKPIRKDELLKLIFKYLGKNK